MATLLCNRETLLARAVQANSAKPQVISNQSPFADSDLAPPPILTQLLVPGQTICRAAHVFASIGAPSGGGLFIDRIHVAR